MSKYSSYKDFQLITESWRKYLTEEDPADDTEEVVATAAEVQSSPEGQEAVEAALDSPEVHAALQQAIEQLKQPALQEYRDIKTSYTPGQLPGIPGQSNYTPDELEGQMLAVAGASGGLSSVFALNPIFAALSGTAAWEALVGAVGIAVPSLAVAGGTIVGATALATLAAYLGEKGVVALAKGLYDLSTRGADEEPPEIGSSRERFE